MRESAIKDGEITDQLLYAILRDEAAMRPSDWRIAVIPPQEALARLREGNRRFVKHAGEGTFVTHDKPIDLMHDQEPFAIILGCSDSRVPAEIVFDQGLGDLFVIRVAGNIVAPSQVGSVEFAAEHSTPGSWW